MSRWPIAVPALLGLGGAGVLLATVPTSEVTVRSSVALAAAVAGLLATAVAAVGVAVARRARRARQAAVHGAIEAERAAAAAAHRRFLVRLDHELKNPLTALLAALADGDGGEAARAQAERIRALLADLRRIADIETAPLETVVTPVEPVLQDAIDLVADTGRDIRLDVPSAPWSPTVRADPDLLLVAVHNVLVNAVKYSGPSDVIEVRARESGSATPVVTIEVADTGPGIAEDDQAVVWEELARGHPSADVPGSGVGLALVRLILERHGGSADLSSRLGTGTAVALHLPAVRPEAAPARLPDPDHRAQVGRTG